MSKQKLLLLPDTVPNAVLLVCPECGYKPPLEEELPPAVSMSDYSPATHGYDPLDFFEVGGCDEGNIMCPRCCKEFVFVPVLKEGAKA